ncbi:MAG: energy-coupling factor transporter ATPase [Chloroflexota bacterium]
MALIEHTGHPDLYVDAAEVVSVLGAPGSGKTRLALELAFLQRPENGEVLLRGNSPLVKRRGFGMQHRPRDVTVLVQNAEEQLFARTVYDDVAFGPRRMRIAEAEIEERVLGALATVRLDPETVRGRSPFALSGGERRRVALAGVLAMRPEVLVLDEPTANLDPQTRNDFLDLLEPLRGKSAVVWFTTSAREAAEANRMYVLQGGRALPVAGGQSIFHNWRQLEAAGVELPAIYELASAMESRGSRLPAAESPDELQEAIVREWKGRHVAR